MESNNSIPSSTRSRAPGHRACIPCARAKAGCIPVSPPDLNNRCERCIRLRKKCEPVAVKARVRSRRTGETRAYVQKLEEKIDGLVTLIQSRESDGVDPHGNLPRDPPLHENQMPSLLSGSNSIVSESLVNSIDGDVYASLSASNSRSYSMESASVSVSTPQSLDVVNDILSAQEAERCLDLFRIQMSPSFPFIWVEESVTAADLRRNRPFFFLCIMAVTTGSTDRKNAMRKLITESLARRMYVNNERSLDLLLGILTYLAWSHHLIIFKGQKTALFSSASALIIDLEINRPSNMKVSTRDYNIFEAADSNTTRIHQPSFNSFETIEDTAEVRRAFLAHFYLSSISSALLQQAEPPRVTKYLKDCYQMLIESDDPNDYYAGVLVESQLIFERMTQAPWINDTQPVTMPTQFFIKAMQEQLGKFREKRAKGSQRNAKLLLLCNSMDIHLYRIGMSPSYSSDLESAANNFERLEVLYSCLRAVKSYFDIFLTIPAGEYQAMTLPDICLFRHALFALYQLSTFEHENWSLDCCRQTISLGDTLGKLGGRFEQASAAVGFDNHMYEKQDWFTRGAKHLQGVRDYWERRETAELGSTTHITTLPAYTQVGDIDLLDDSFLREILSPWDNQSMGYQNFVM